MTPQERAQKVVAEVREHKMFDVDTDGTWERHIESAIEQATEGYLPIPDANEFDDVVRLLGIEDSHIKPVEAVQELLGQAKAWKEACRKAGVCMSCAIGAPESFGCTDCLNTGWSGGSPELKRVHNTHSNALPREPGTCKCGAAPINADGLCATCADDQNSVGSPTTSDRLAAELSFDRLRQDSDPVTDSSLTYGDLRRLAKQRELLIEAERAVEEYSCRTSVPHVANEMSGLASRIRTALSEERRQVSDAA